MYIYKRHDAVAITIEPITNNIIIDHDKICNFIETCYVGPVGVLEKKLQDKNHAIRRLPVHFPNKQNVLIENKATEEAMTSALSHDYDGN